MTLRREAEERLAAARKATRLLATARRKLAALRAAMKAFAEHRAIERGVEVNHLTLEDVLVTADERALVRLVAACSVEVGAAPKVSPRDTLDRVVARLAFERGWNIADAARAILGMTALVDDIHNNPQRAKARRVQDAMKVVLKVQIENVDRQLAALDGGQAMDLDELRRALRALRKRLVKALKRRLIRPPRGSQST